MVAYKKLDETLAVAGQLFASHLESLKAQGFTSIICNRPDYEEDVEDQPLSSELERHASELGLQFAYIPVDGSGPTLQAVQQTKEVLDGSEGPVVAYCMTGKRSVMLYALAKSLDSVEAFNEMLSNAQKQGYNLSGLRPILDTIAA